MERREGGREGEKEKGDNTHGTSANLKIPRKLELQFCKLSNSQSINTFPSKQKSAASSARRIIVVGVSCAIALTGGSKSGVEENH